METEKRRWRLGPACSRCARPRILGWSRWQDRDYTDDSALLNGDGEWSGPNRKFLLCLRQAHCGSVRSLAHRRRGLAERGQARSLPFCCNAAFKAARKCRDVAKFSSLEGALQGTSDESRGAARRIPKSSCRFIWLLAWIVANGTASILAARLYLEPTRRWVSSSSGIINSSLGEFDRLNFGP